MNSTCNGGRKSLIGLLIGGAFAIGGAILTGAASQLAANTMNEVDQKKGWSKKIATSLVGEEAN